MGLFEKFLRPQKDSRPTAEKLKEIRLMEELYESGKFLKLLDAVDKAMQFRPDDSRLWFMKGMAFWHLCKYSEALPCLDKAVNLNPRGAGAWAFKGDSLLKLGRTNDAKDAFNRFLAVAPPEQAKQVAEVKGILSSLEQGGGRASNENERTEQARAVAEKARDSAEKGNYEEALASYDEALRIAPASEKSLLSTLWFLRDTPCRKLWKWDDSLHCWNKILEIGPDGVNNWHDGAGADAWCQKGFALEVLKKGDEALACYNEVLRMNPSNEVAEHVKEKQRLLAGNKLTAEIIVKTGIYLSSEEGIQYFKRYEEQVLKWARKIQGAFYWYYGVKVENAKGKEAALPYFAASLSANPHPDALAWSKFEGAVPSSQAAEQLVKRYPLPSKEPKKVEGRPRDVARTISFVCPECRKQYSVKHELAGRRVKCVCGHVLTVPRRTPSCP